MSGFVALFIHSSVIVTSLDPGFIGHFFSLSCPVYVSLEAFVLVTSAEKWYRDH